LDKGGAREREREREGESVELSSFSSCICLSVCLSVAVCVSVCLLAFLSLQSTSFLPPSLPSSFQGYLPYLARSLKQPAAAAAAAPLLLLLLLHLTRLGGCGIRVG
jgi:hypothetical protein